MTHREVLNCPIIETYIDIDNFIVKTDLHGIDLKEVTISTDNGYLIIKGTNHLDIEIEEETYLAKEAYYRAFERRIAIPKELEGQSFRTIYNKESNLLEVIIPLKKQDP